jgi:hypothetical protein
MIPRCCSIPILALLAASSCVSTPARPLSSFGSGSQRQPSPWTGSGVHGELRADGARQSAPLTSLPPPKSEDAQPTFCKLNPGACPPLPPPSEPAPQEQAMDPWKSFACIQACNAGSAAMEQFCSALPDRTKRQKEIRAICWGVSRGGRAACVVFCRAYFGPPREP